MCTCTHVFIFLFITANVYLRKTKCVYDLFVIIPLKSVHDQHMYLKGHQMKAINPQRISLTEPRR